MKDGYSDRYPKCLSQKGSAKLEKFTLLRNISKVKRKNSYFILRKKTFIQ